MIKAFIFDMDGVIIDSEPMHLEVDFETVQHLGIDLTRQDLEKYVGMANPEMWGQIKQQFNLHKSVEEIIAYQLKRKIAIIDEMDIEPIEGIRALINELQNSHVAIGLASSSPREFIEKVLKKFNIIEHFSCITSGEEIGRGKPAPDVYLEAARILNVNPEHCIALEDSKNGVTAANKAGMKCIGFINPNSGTQDLSEAVSTVKSIKEINVKELINLY